MYIDVFCTYDIPRIKTMYTESVSNTYMINTSDSYINIIFEKGEKSFINWISLHKGYKKEFITGGKTKLSCLIYSGFYSVSTCRSPILHGF